MRPRSHALVRKAGIDLNKKASEQDPEAEGKNAISPMFKSLGYFSLIGLLRVNALAPLFTSVLSCHVSLYYFMGLSYLMCRRYGDAIKIFCYFLTYTQRNKHVIARSTQVDLVQRRVDQMLGLLGIAYVLSGASNSPSDRSWRASPLRAELEIGMVGKTAEQLGRWPWAVTT